jgi:hypothetical protein
VNREEQLSWEARLGRPVAIASFIAAILEAAGLIYGSSAIKEQQVKGVTTATVDRVDSLRLFSEHHGQVAVSTVLQCLSVLLLAAPLWFLYTATRARRREIPPAARYLAVAAPIVLSILIAVNQALYVHVADRITRHLAANPMFAKAANDYATEQLKSITVIQSVGLAAGLALAFAFVLISLNAMRAGLLSRFMGILGIIVGVLFVLPILGQVPFVEIFWVAALGFLFLGRWPQGGRGPAWESGEAIPWPTAQDRAAAMAEARADRQLEREEAREPVAAGGRRPVPEEGLDGDGPVTNQHPRSKKRKRKRR